MRQYQLDLYRAACRRNVIAYLDTGSGKTFISVLLIRDIVADLKRVELQDGACRKSVFFLVPRKVLVHQQADVLKQFTDLAVSEHSGDRNNEDVWDHATWNGHITKSDVLVMTPQILLNLLRKQMIGISDIALIVFDECHHTRKNNPYNCIMQEFYHATKAARHPVPKIFGMTASLVTKKRSSEEVCNSFFELETNLDCVIMTTSRENVQQHATSANEMDVPYTMNTMHDQLPLTFQLLEKANIRLVLANRLSLQHHRGRSGNSSWQMESKKVKGPLEQQIRQIGNVQHVISVMGLLAGSYALSEVAENWHEKENKKLATWNFPSSVASSIDLNVFDDRFEKHRELGRENFGNMTEALFLSVVDMAVAVMAGLFQMSEAAARQELGYVIGNRPLAVRQVQVALRQLRSRLDLSPLEKLLESTSPQPEDLKAPPNPSCSVFASHRMQQLLKVLMLEKSRIPTDQLSKWRGMIFVQQTIMAIVLEHVLSLHPQLSFFKCQSLTGHNGAILSASMEDHHQRKIVEMFRSGRANLLISTSVAEEGLDITQCSMVIRFDLPFTEASYIQSRGRARKPGSSYFMFVNAEDPGEQTMVGNLRFAEHCMKEFASYRQQQDEMDDDEDMISGTQDAYVEISRSEEKAVVPAREGGNEVGQHTAPEMIAKYVQQLPQDEYCKLAPHLIFRSREEKGKKDFQYQLTLPVNAAVTRPILGEWCPSKLKAKRSACYAACCELRNLGELNKRFYPISHRENAESKRKTIKVNAVPVSVNTPIDPDSLRPTHAIRTQERRLSANCLPGNLILHLQIAVSTPLDTNATTSTEKSVLFGILTLKRLDNLMRFPLYPETGNIEVEFQDGGDVLVSNAELVKLKKYHLAVVESLYFKTKLFTTVCREKREDLDSLIDADLDFLPEQLKAHQDKVSNINQSWYLLCPIQAATPTQATHLEDPFFGEKSSDEEDASVGEKSPCEIDWEMIQHVGDRVRHLHTPDITKLHPDLSTLKRGAIIISPYNQAAYKLVGIRSDLNLHSAFPSRPKAEFYDPSVTKEYKGSFVPNRSGRQFSTFLEYYTEHWKFKDLDEEQPLLECVTFKQVPVMKKAKNLLNPVWKQAMEVDVPEEHCDDWNTAVHVLPQLLVLYPLDYPFWQSLGFVVAICWKLESMMKLHELRHELFSPQEERIEASLAPPDVALIYESVTSKSCHEHCTYERLEFLGDVALKYISSLYCFFKYPLGHEGVLTTERSSIISNRQLATVALSMGLEKYIRTVQLGDHPWRPAGCQFMDAYWIHTGKKGVGHTWFGGRNQKASQMNQMHQAKVCTLAVKQVADVVEALLGACFIFGDVPLVCALANRLGLLEDSASFLLRTVDGKPEHGAWLKDVGNLMTPGLRGLEDFEQMRKRHFDHDRDILALEKSIGYHFESPSFALEALTHCSWPHHDPPCYQRLEYLGDAILDFMISVHYFQAYDDLDPGRLTALRSASVNNDRLAVSAVKTALHKYILHFSPYLQSHITNYVAGYSDGETTGAPKVLGDVVESLIGAVYLDLNGDLQATWTVWDPLLQPYFTPESVPVHPVVQLINFCHNRGLSLEFVTVKKPSTSEGPSDNAIAEEMDLSESEGDDEEEDEDWIADRPCGKHGLMQMEARETPKRKCIQVVVNGKVVGEGEGAHVKGAKKQAALVAMESTPWDLN